MSLWAFGLVKIPQDVTFLPESSNLGCLHELPILERRLMITHCSGDLVHVNFENNISMLNAILTERRRSLFFC